jgi:hypothetical protein
MQQSEQPAIRDAPRLAFLIREFKRSVAHLHQRNFEIECFLRGPLAASIIREIVQQELESQRT